MKEESYRRLAAEARAQADKAISNDHREAWLDIMKGYLELANSAAGENVAGFLNNGRKPFEG